MIGLSSWVSFLKPPPGHLTWRPVNVAVSELVKQLGRGRAEDGLVGLKVRNLSRQ
jgi:hypothetical protein